MFKVEIEGAHETTVKQFRSHNIALCYAMLYMNRGYHVRVFDPNGKEVEL